MWPALQIMREYTTPDDAPLQDAIKQVEAFVRKALEIHEPITGEAYPEDRNRYCAVCMSADGGSRRYPCGTVKAIRRFLDDGTTSTEETSP